MIDYATLVFTVSMCIICTIGMLFFIGVAIISVSEFAFGDFIVCFFFSLFLFVLASMCYDVSTDIYSQIKERNAHPCLEWGNHYETGKLGRECIFRK